jgi:hypothetical protein
MLHEIRRAATPPILNSFTREEYVSNPDFIIFDQTILIWRYTVCITRLKHSQFTIFASNRLTAVSFFQDLLRSLHSDISRIFSCDASWNEAPLECGHFGRGSLACLPPILFRRFALKTQRGTRYIEPLPSHRGIVLRATLIVNHGLSLYLHHSNDTQVIMLELCVQSMQRWRR